MHKKNWWDKPHDNVKIVSSAGPNGELSGKCWWYEGPNGIFVVTQTESSNNSWVSTTQVFIPWISIRAALRRKDYKLAPLSPSEQEKRKPLPPEMLVNALQDTIHHEAGKMRRVVRTRKIKAK